MKSRKILPFMFAVAVTASMFTGCGSNAAQNVPQSTASQGGTETTAAADKSGSLEDTLNYANAEASAIVDEVAVSVGNEITDLAPWSSTSAGRTCVLPVIYEYLAFYDTTQENGVSGILMKEFEQIDDITYRITIFDYISDSAGNQVTAEDVAWCFTTWKEKGLSVKTKSMTSCTAVEDYVVEFVMTNDTVGEIQNIICGQVPIVSKAAYVASGDEMIENVISTAPYKVVEYVSGSHLIVEGRDDYWQTDKELILPNSRVNAGKITFRIITEKAQVAINLETNAVDIAPGMSYSEAKRFEEGGGTSTGYRVFTTEDPNFYFITFNCSPGGLFEDNAALRQAICYAIDSQGLVQGVLNGAGEVNYAYGNPICADYNEAWSNQDYYGYNLEKAKKLLDESGFDKSQTIRMMSPSGDIPKTSAQIIQSYLMQIGINCEIMSYDQALFQTYKNADNEWDIMFDSKMSNDYVTSLTSTLIVDGDSKAINFVQDEKLQELASGVGTVSGHTEEKIDEYMSYIKDQCYVYALFHANNFYVTEDTLEDVFVNYKGTLIPGACVYSEEFKR